MSESITRRSLLAAAASAPMAETPPRELPPDAPVLTGVRYEPGRLVLTYIMPGAIRKVGITGRVTL